MKDLYKTIASEWIDHVFSSNDNQKQKDKKILEICHFASFVISLYKANYITDVKQVSIENISEEPDFIVNYIGTKIGLELRQIKNERAEEIGKQQSLLNDAAKYFEQEYAGIKCLANINFTNGFSFTQKEKKLAKAISQYVYNVYAQTPIGKPKYIRSINTMKHSNVSFSLKGAYSVGHLSAKYLLSEIASKENKIKEYREKSGMSNIGLLLIFSGASPDSDFSFVELPPEPIQTNFDKVFLLDDFGKEIYILK